MILSNKNILSLIESVKIDELTVSCHFRCDVKNKTIISTVPFEPYDGKIEITWQDKVLHPIKSYNRYYHTPITIYGDETQETIVLKAFKKVSKHFSWNSAQQRYIHN